MANNIKEMADHAARLIAEAEEVGKSYLRKYIEAGLALLDLKKACAHGEFGPACDEVGVSRRQAQRYMSAAKNFVARGDDIDNLPDIWISEYLGWKSTRAVSGQFVVGSPGGPGRGHKPDDAKDESDGKQYIYVICNPLIPEWVKVGMSDNPCRRAKEMQTYAPEDYFVAYQAELPDGFRDTTIHPFLSSNFDSNREWFRCPADEAIDIIKYHLDGLTDERFAA